MADTGISNVAAIAACNAIVDLLDGGAGAATIEIRTGGAPAGGPDAAATGTLLATLTCTDPAFGNASDAAPGGQATAAAITDDSSADAAGTAGWFRAMDSDSTPIIDGDITLTSGGGDMEMDNTDIAIGQVISISAWTATMPEG